MSEHRRLSIRVLSLIVLALTAYSLGSSSLTAVSEPLQTILVPSQVPSLQEAINIAAPGTVIVLEPGYTSGPVNITGKNSIIIVSSQPGTARIASTSTQAAVTINTSYNIVIENVEIDSPYVAVNATRSTVTLLNVTFTWPLTAVYAGSNSTIILDMVRGYLYRLVQAENATSIIVESPHLQQPVLITGSMGQLTVRNMTGGTLEMRVQASSVSIESSDVQLGGGEIASKNRLYFKIENSTITPVSTDIDILNVEAPHASITLNSTTLTAETDSLTPTLLNITVGSIELTLENTTLITPKEPISNSFIRISLGQLQQSNTLYFNGIIILDNISAILPAITVGPWSAVAVYLPHKAGQNIPIHIDLTVNNATIAAPRQNEINNDGTEAGGLGVNTISLAAVGMLNDLKLMKYVAYRNIIININNITIKNNMTSHSIIQIIQIIKFKDKNYFNHKYNIKITANNIRTNNKTINLNSIITYNIMIIINESSPSIHLEGLYLIYNNIKINKIENINLSYIIKINKIIVKSNNSIYNIYLLLQDYVIDIKNLENIKIKEIINYNTLYYGNSKLLYNPNQNYCTIKLENSKITTANIVRMPITILDTKLIIYNSIININDNLLKIYKNNNINYNSNILPFVEKQINIIINNSIINILNNDNYNLILNKSYYFDMILNLNNDTINIYRIPDKFTLFYANVRQTNEDIFFKNIVINNYLNSTITSILIERGENVYLSNITVKSNVTSYINITNVARLKMYNLKIDGYIKLYNCSIISYQNVSVLGGPLVIVSGGRFNSSKVYNVSMPDGRIGEIIIRNASNIIINNINVYTKPMFDIVRSNASIVGFNVIGMFAYNSTVFVFLCNINSNINIYNFNSTIIWESPGPVAYEYNSSTYYGYLGDYYGNVRGIDSNNDGILDGVVLDGGVPVLAYPADHYRLLISNYSSLFSYFNVNISLIGAAYSSGVLMVKLLATGDYIVIISIIKEYINNNGVLVPYQSNITETFRLESWRPSLAVFYFKTPRIPLINATPVGLKFRVIAVDEHNPSKIYLLGEVNVTDSQSLVLGLGNHGLLLASKPWNVGLQTVKAGLEAEEDPPTDSVEGWAPNAGLMPRMLMLGVGFLAVALLAASRTIVAGRS